MIIGVGGGSAIDTAKAIAHGTANSDQALWDLWTKKVPLNQSLPVGAVLTIPAAGSEMSDSAVLTNTAIGKKAGIGSQLMVKMLGLLKWQGYERASLAVQKENYAVKMYEGLGFRTTKETDEEFIMAIEL